MRMKAIAVAMLAVVLVTSLVLVGSPGTDADGDGISRVVIGGTGYAGVMEAVAAAETGTIIELTDDVTEDVVIPRGADLVLDLGGHRLTNVSSHTVTVEEGAKLTISNGTVDNVSHARAALYNMGELTVTDGTFIRSAEVVCVPDNGFRIDNSWYLVVNMGTMVIDGGDFHTGDGTPSGLGNFSSLLVNGFDVTVDSQKVTVPGTITINGGTFTNAANVIKNNSGNVTINGGRLTMDNTAHGWFGGNICIQHVLGDLTVNGGVISAIGSGVGIDPADADYVRTLVMEHADAGEITFVGGDVYVGGPNTYMFRNLSEEVDIVIDGGSFRTAPDAESTIGVGSMVLNGGSFFGYRPVPQDGRDIDVTIYGAGFDAMMEGSVASVMKDGLKLYYNTLADAISSAEGGSVIEMVSDELSTGTIAIDKSVTIRGNGMTFVGTFDIVPSEGGTIAMTLDGFRFVKLTGGLSDARVDVTAGDSTSLSFGTLRLTLPAGGSFTSDGKVAMASDVIAEGAVPQGFDLVVSTKVVIPSGKALSGSVWFDGNKDNGVTLDRVTAGESGITLSRGSVAIAGDLVSSDGTITVTGVARITDDAVIDGVTLIVPAGASLTVEEGVSVTGTGTVSNRGTVKVLGNLATAMDNSSDATVCVALTGSVDKSRISGEGRVLFDSIVIRDVGTRYCRVGDRVDIPVTVNPATAELSMDYSVSPSWLSIVDGHIVGVAVQDGSFNVTVKASMQDRETVSESFVLNVAIGVDPDQPHEHQYTSEEIVRIAIIILVVLMVICLVTRAFIG